MRSRHKITKELKAFIKLLKKLDCRQKEGLLRLISRMQGGRGYNGSDCKDCSSPNSSKAERNR